MHANTFVAVGIKGGSKAMGAMNKQIDPAKQLKVIQDFQLQFAQTDMTTEMMSESIGDALDNDEAEDESEELTNQLWRPKTGPSLLLLRFLDIMMTFKIEITNIYRKAIDEAYNGVDYNDGGPFGAVIVCNDEDC